MRRVIFVVCVFVVVTLGKHIEQKTRGKAQSEVKVGNNPMTHCADKDCSKQYIFHVRNTHKQHNKRIKRRRIRGKKGHRKSRKTKKFLDHGSLTTYEHHSPNANIHVLPKSFAHKTKAKTKMPISSSQERHFPLNRDRLLTETSGLQLNDRNNKALPKSKRYELPAEDPDVIYKNYGWDTKANVPRGVARLEDKMYPNIRHAAKKFMDNLQTILHKIQRQIRMVDDEYITVGKKSRDAMKDVRSELQQITHENDKVYDTMLDVSQLVRYVYRRAHEHGLAGSKNSNALSRIPEISNFNLHNHLSDSEHANYSASVVYHRVMDLKRRGIQQDESKSTIIKKVKAASLSEKFRYFEIYDLRQRCRLAVQKADVLATNVLIPVRNRIMKYKMSKVNISEKIHHAKYLTGLAYQSTKASRDAYQLSKKYHDTAIRGKRQVRRKRSINQKQLESLVQRTQRTSKQVENTAEIVQRTLSPLVFRSHAIIAKLRSGTAGILTEVKGILVKMVYSLSKLDDKIDEVRMYLNESRIIEARCEELEGSSSVLQCDKYGVFEGSGSGMVDDDDLFTYSSTPIATRTTISPETSIHMKSTTKGSSTNKLNSLFPSSTQQTTATPGKTQESPTSTIPTNPSITTTSTTTTLKPSTTSTTPSTTTIITTKTSRPSTTTTTPSTTTTTTTPSKPSAISTTSSTTTTNVLTPSSSTTKALPNISSTTTTTSNSSIPTTIPSTTQSPATSTSTSPSTTSTKITTLQPKSSTTTEISLTPDESELEGSATEVTGSGDSTTDDGDFVFETTTSETLTDPIATTTSTTAVQGTTASKTPIQIITTEKAPLTFSSTLKSTTTSVVIEEGSGSKEDDFTFEENDKDKKEDEEKKDGGYWWWSDDSNVLYDHKKDLKEKLSKKAFEARQVSENIYEQLKPVSGRWQDIANRWDKVNRTLGYLQSFVYGARELQFSWNTAELLFNKIHTSIPNRTSTVMDKSNIATAKAENALNIINKKLDTMVKLKKDKLSKSETEEGGPAFIADLISKVQTARQNSKEILRLRQINPSPCSSVQNTATRLRSSIAQLRSKIEKAKTIASSIPLSISLSGKEAVRASVFDTTLSVSTSSSIDMCIKPSAENMHVATFHGNNSQVYSLSLEDSKPVMKVTAKDGSDMGSVSFETGLELDDWHSLTIKRFGRTIELITKKLNETDEEKVEDSYLPKIDSYHSPVTEVIIGKPTDGSDLPYFSGCVGDVMVDGKVVPFNRKDGKLQYCTTGRCISRPTKSMIFEGDGFVMFSPTLVDASYIDNIDINFQTLQRDAVLLYINHKHKLLQVLITLREGGIHIEVSTRRGTTVLSSVIDDYSDGNDHFIEIIFGNDVIDVTTDIVDDKFEQELVRQEIAPRIPDGIYLGGLDVQSHSLSGKTKLRSFAGCLSSVTISNKELSLPLMERSRNVYYGMCSENMWRKCVKFTDQSKPIKFSKSGDHKSISIVFGTDSLGTLLNFQRVKGEDFDFTIIYDGKSLEISNNKDDVDYMMTSHNQDKDWHVLTVEDTGNEELKVSFDSSIKTLPYNVPWRWITPVLEYIVAVGGLPDSETATFLGGISTIILNDRPIKLDEMMSDNNLRPCEKKISTHLMSDMEEKPVC